MSRKHHHPHHPHYPATLVKYIALPGEYGNLDVIAESAHAVRLQLTDEYVDLSRVDAQEMIRVLSGWLAAPASRLVVNAEGDETVVVVDAESGQGPKVVVVEESAERSHVVEGSSRPT